MNGATIGEVFCEYSLSESMLNGSRGCYYRNPIARHIVSGWWLLAQFMGEYAKRF
jgi:hypothetical protein